MDALIRLDEVTKRYDSAAAPAVDGVSMQIAAGEAVAVMGPLTVLMLARFAVCDRWLYRPAGRRRASAPP